MISSKKVIGFSRRQRQANALANPPVRLSFFNKLSQRYATKVGGAVISALIVLHFVSHFFIFQNDNVQIEIDPPKIENVQIAENKPVYEPVKSDVVATPEPIAPPAIVQIERKASQLSKIKTVKKKQHRESKAARLRPSKRTERIIRTEEVASLYPYGRFLTR